MTPFLKTTQPSSVGRENTAHGGRLPFTSFDFTRKQNGLTKLLQQVIRRKFPLFAGNHILHRQYTRFYLF